MTPPKISSVDISATKDLHLEVYQTSFQPGEYAANQRSQEIANHLNTQLNGSDIYYDPENITFAKIVNGDQIQEIDILEEAQFVQEIAKADTDQDNQLSKTELKAFLTKFLGEEEASRHDLDAWLKELQWRMENRYEPIAKNLRTFSADLKWQPTLDAIKAYTHGLYLEDIRQSQTFLHPNQFLKSAGNITMFLPAAVYNGAMAVSGNEGVPFLIADQVAFELAEESKNDREAALGHFYATLVKGSKVNTEWYQNQDIEATLEYMETEMGPEYAKSAEVLRRELPIVRLHKILIQEDEQQIYKDLLEFAKHERPQFLKAFGGGNTNRSIWDGTDDSHWYNLFGTLDDTNFYRVLGNRHNLYFANSIFSMLMRRRLTDNPEFDAQMQGLAEEQRTSMVDHEGGWSNLIVSAITFGRHPLENWSDVAALDGVGQFLNFTLWFFQGPKVLQGLQDLGALRRTANPHGLAHVVTQWGRNGRPWNPLRGMGHERTRAAICRFNAAKAWGIGAKKQILMPRNVDELANKIDDLVKTGEATNRELAALEAHGSDLANKIRGISASGKLADRSMNLAEFNKLLETEGKLTVQEWEALSDASKILAKEGFPYNVMSRWGTKVKEKLFLIPGAETAQGIHSLQSRMMKAAAGVRIPGIGVTAGDSFMNWVARIAMTAWTQGVLLPNTGYQEKQLAETNDPIEQLKAFDSFANDQAMDLTPWPDPTQVDSLVAEHGETTEE